MIRTSVSINKDNGFTLIELMIVIAIIGVLAAIAMPLFSTYQQRSFDSVALSDLKNYRVTEEGFYYEHKTFGYSTDSGADGGLSLVSGPGDSETMISDGSHGLVFGLSNHVSIYGVVGSDGNAYNVASKHLSGTRIFGADSDSTGLYYSNSEAGTSLAVGDTPDASTPGNEFGGWNSL